MMGDLKRPCPQHTECLAVYDENGHHHPAPPLLFTWPEWFPLFPWMKKVLKGKCFADVQQVNQKVAGAQKGIKIDDFKNGWVVGKTCW